MKNISDSNKSQSQVSPIQNRTKEDNSGEIIDTQVNSDSSHDDWIIDTYVNKGFSLIGDQSDLIFRPASTLSKYSIFDHKIKIDEVLKGISTDEIILEKFDRPKINKGQKEILEYKYEEIKNAMDFVIHGEYKVPYNNYLYERARSIQDLKTKKTVMYFHEKIDFTLTLDTQKSFPRLTKAFIADAIRIFQKPEITDLNQEKAFVHQGLNFFYKYGTHYLNRTKYGSRFTWISELNLTKWDNRKSADDTTRNVSNFKSGSIAFESSRDSKSDRFTHFEISSEIGNCEINMMDNRMEKCNGTLGSIGLLGFEVEYLYRIFDSERIKAPIIQPDNTPLTADKLKNIFTNMKMLLDSLVSAVDIRNLYLKDFIVFNNLRADDGDPLPCSKYYKIKRFGDIPNSLFNYDNRDNRLIPVFKLNDLNKINHQHPFVISKSRTQTFVCNMKDRLFDNSLIDSPYLFNTKYLTDIRFFDIKDFDDSNENRNRTLGYKLDDCHNFWVDNTSNLETNTNMNILLICLKYSNVFLDNKILTDVKIKSFSNNECKKFNLNNRDYECLCDQELKNLVNINKTKKDASTPDGMGAADNSTKGTTSVGKVKSEKKNIFKFLCYARKILKD